MMPGAKPWEAASAACRGSAPAGRPVTKSSPSRVERSPLAAARSTTTHTTTIASAPARCVARCARRARSVGRPAGAAASPACAAGAASGLAAGRSLLGQNTSRPNTASSAGTSVTETTRPMTTLSASPGPKSRKNGCRATISAAVPAATISPAVRMIGVYWAVVARAASRRLWPASRRARKPVM